MRKNINSMNKFCYNPVLKKAKQTTAFTLVEVMISVAVLGLVFASLAATLTQGHLIIENARDETRVAQILQSELEDMRAKAWSDIDAMASPQQFTPQGNFVAAFFDRYTCERIINARKADQKEIILTVTWIDNKNINHSRKYTTYYTKEGLNDYFYRSF